MIADPIRVTWDVSQWPREPGPPRAVDLLLSRPLLRERGMTDDEGVAAARAAILALHPDCRVTARVTGNLDLHGERAHSADIGPRHWRHAEPLTAALTRALIG